MNYKIRYVKSGEGDRHVLFIHGLGGSAESWIYNIDVFAKYFHVFAPDLLGFGKSDKPKIRYDMKTFINFVTTFMDSVEIRKTHVVGSSLGGQIAAEFALSFPERVKKLVLVSPAGIPPKSFKGTAELKKYVKVLNAKDPDDVRKALAPIDSNSSVITEDYVKSVYEYVMMPGTRHAFLSSLQESAKAQRLANRLKAIKAQTFVVWGKHDNLIPIKYCEPFVTKMENCRLLLIEKCGHRPHAEKAPVFNQAVMDFLKEN
ncbi:MAG: alpha/beta hydrolase [Nitrososphaerales archaeon]